MGVFKLPGGRMRDERVSGLYKAHQFSLIMFNGLKWATCLQQIGNDKWFLRRERMNSDFMTCPSCLRVVMNWTLITNRCFLPQRRDSGTNSATKNTLNLPFGAKLQDRGSARLHFSGPTAAQREDNVSLYGCSQIKRADGRQILFNYLAFYNSKYSSACCLFNFLRGFTNYTENELCLGATALLSLLFSFFHFL